LRRKLVFVTSHPIQYQVPIFRHLAAQSDLDFHVLFAMLPYAKTQGAGFGVNFSWDIPLLEGFTYSVLENVANQPSVTSFRGCDTPSIYHKLREIRPDLVITNGWVVKTCLQALWACKRLSIKVAVRGEANLIRRRPRWKLFLQRQLVRRYDYALPIGKANRKFYEFHGFSPHQLFASPYCVENKRFTDTAEAKRPLRPSLRKQWNVASDAVCFLYCGKFETKKHPGELLASFAASAKTVPNLHLLMVGDGHLLNDCRKYANDHNLSVSFTGFLNQSQIVDAYIASDVLILPSDSGETWGLVVNEAMSCGLPAIVSDQVGCQEDLIMEGRTGWRFPFGDWQQLTDTICSIGRQRETWRDYPDHCLKHVANYSPTIAAKGMTQALEHCVLRSTQKS
jgi:glycosyltransferase involved in cell wall biosynthesis